MSGSAEEQIAQQPEQVAAVPQPAGSGASLPTLRDREPAVPFLQQLALPQGVDCLNCSPSEVSVGEVFATPENILSENMAHEMNNDIENSSELKELVELAMNDFSVGCYDVENTTC